MDIVPLIRSSEPFGCLISFPSSFRLVLLTRPEKLKDSFPKRFLFLFLGGFLLYSLELFRWEIVKMIRVQLKLQLLEVTSNFCYVAQELAWNKLF